MAERFGVPCGFSDHSLGTDVASMAVAAGAMCIEKHLTLDPSRAGFDHPISLGPQQFAQMVDSIRRTQLILGVAGKPLTGDLRQARERYLRCVVANEPIPAGTPLSVENMAVKRPLPDRRGIAADQYKAVLGRRALVDIEADEPITPSSIED
jgi:sialic acid synthase SpsE